MYWKVKGNGRGTVLKTCWKHEELLARHLHGDSLLQDREALEEHLAVCPDCERLYRDVSDVDRLLRDIPGKQVDPPAYLFARILANLPEAQPASAWERWGRWAAGFAAVSACALAVAVTLFRGGVPREPRLASAPPSIQGPESPVPSPAPAAPGAEETARTPVLRPGPDASRKRAEEAVVSSAPKVKVIQQVKIYFYYPPARQVAVTGDFNDWNIDGVPMRVAGKPGLWAAELNLPPGVYSYNFIVDGEILLPDPDAPNQMPDGYGGTNSILLVKGGEGAI
jgi:hypothetical protein